MGEIDFYHYTTKSGKDAIVESGMIRKSGGSQDAFFGTGVYGTSLSPEAGKRLIAQNNWDDARKPSWRMLSKAAWAIKVIMSEDEVEKPGVDRDILLYPGDLYLDNYSWEVIKV